MKPNSHSRANQETSHQTAMGRTEFLRMATAFQGGILLVALVVAWLAGLDLRQQFLFSRNSLLWGVIATGPMLVLFALTYNSTMDAFKAIKELLFQLLGNSLSQCRWYELLYVACLAGVSEEVLFRGVLQFGIDHWNPNAGLIVSSVLFGLAHALTPTYAILAGLLGVYLGFVFEITGEPNLVPAILCHSLYDFIAFMVIRSATRKANDHLCVTDAREITEVSDGGHVDSRHDVIEEPESDDSQAT